MGEDTSKHTHTHTHTHMKHTEKKEWRNKQNWKRWKLKLKSMEDKWERGKNWNRKFLQSRRQCGTYLKTKTKERQQKQQRQISEIHQVQNINIIRII